MNVPIRQPLMHCVHDLKFTSGRYNNSAVTRDMGNGYINYKKSTLIS